jgi:hypothetical protein
MIYPERVMVLAQENYKRIKLARGQTPREIPSDQIRALCEALCEEINKQLDDVQDDLSKLRK